MQTNQTENQAPGWRALPRNVWAVGVTSFFMDVSSDMVNNILPLYLANVLGLPTSLIGLIEGVAEAAASLLKMFSGWFSDRIGARKWLAVLGYALSALSKPFFLFNLSWPLVAGARWADRVGKGIRTAPRDALVADSTPRHLHGLAFGIHRALDNAGAFIGLLIAYGVIVAIQRQGASLERATFNMLIWFSLVPALLAVLSLALGARDVAAVGEKRSAPKIGLRGLGGRFGMFLALVGLFTLGNSSDGFLVLRAQNLGVPVSGVLLILVLFNGVAALVSGPAGALSDKIGRRRLIVAGWLLYAAIYAGFGMASQAWHAWLLYGLYGVYYGLAQGNATALVADLVPAHLRGTAYGTYHAAIGILAFPSSLLAGILWQGVGGWAGWGASAPFYVGGGLALAAALGMAWFLPRVPHAASQTQP